VSDFIPEVKMDRITMTAPLVNAARQVVFLVAGEDKAEAVRDVLFGQRNVDEKPAQLIQPDVLFGQRNVDEKPAQLIQPDYGELSWMLDAEAASHLPQC
jgi:6-phosphogluconolactonase